MSNPGKEFEKDLKASIPPSMWFYRFRDGTATFYGGMQQDNGVRFQQSNICDCQMFRFGVLVLAELKSHKGKSLPHSQFKDKKGNVKHLPEMVEATKHEGIVSGVLINMRDVGETFWMYADIVLDHIMNSGIKSIPLAFMREYGMRVRAEQKKVHWRYDIDALINQISDKELRA